MFKKSYRPANWSLGTRISAIAFGLAATVIATLVSNVTISTSSMLDQRASQNVANELTGVVSTIEVFNKAVSGQAVAFGHILRSALPGTLELDLGSTMTIGDRTVPRLKLDGNSLNLDSSAPDAFAEQMGGDATIFALAGDDFVRVSSSVKKEDGKRDVGSSLDRASPAYAALRAGQPHIELATLSGKHYITRYEPARDISGKVVGALYVAVDVAQDMAALKERIRAIKVGDTGYFFVLNATPGKHLGDLIVHPAKEGQNILNSRDASGKAFIQEIVEKKNGSIMYDWQNPDESSPREKFVAYAHVKDWDWVIAGGTYSDEITAAASALRTRFILLGLAALLVLAGVLHYVIHRTVTRPLSSVRDAAMRIAEGDLTAHVANSRQDEIGRLTAAINAISAGLSGVVGKVRDGAEQIANASREISTGNLDLCNRTEEQAISLASTASSMDELTSTVRQNAEHAVQANELARKASSIAQKGGDTVSQVVARMDSITQASRKISDITGVIDSIAFQTNILALNAAVEAARAGEQGRGFAVVASEVRTLAQRSASAAKEIKALIDASNVEVNAGSRLVAEAGVTMKDVLSSVERVTDIMADISAASQEQTSGIENVNRAVVGMDAATQQNAALVEQASAAAQAMHEQADALARAVRQFHLAEGAATLAPARRPALAR